MELSEIKNIKIAVSKTWSKRKRVFNLDKKSFQITRKVNILFVLICDITYESSFAQLRSKTKHIRNNPWGIHMSISFRVSQETAHVFVLRRDNADKSFPLSVFPIEKLLMLCSFIHSLTKQLSVIQKCNNRKDVFSSLASLSDWANTVIHNKVKWKKKSIKCSNYQRKVFANQSGSKFPLHKLSEGRNAKKSLISLG